MYYFNFLSPWLTLTWLISKSKTHCVECWCLKGRNMFAFNEIMICSLTNWTQSQSLLSNTSASQSADWGTGCCKIFSLITKKTHSILKSMISIKIQQQKVTIFWKGNKNLKKIFHMFWHSVLSNSHNRWHIF